MRYALPEHLTPALFAEWRSPRSGVANPQVMTNELWVWGVTSRAPAWAVNQLFNGPASEEAGPCWCFERFGQSETCLPDGRQVYVGGEHEDFYDPDFYIYNDVVVVAPEGTVSIYGYPREVFPPTDFHTATLVGNELWLIGSVGYRDQRRPGHTQVLRLELATWQVSVVETGGDVPGWLHGHSASLSATGNEILVSGGLVDRCDGTSLVENIDDWSLDMRTGRWARLTRRPRTIFEVFREDRQPNNLIEMYHLRRYRQQGDSDQAAKCEAELIEALGGVPDLGWFETLYAPSFATEILGEDEDQVLIHRIRLGDAMVRYVDDHYRVQVTVDGDLPPALLAQLKQDIVDKFAALMTAPVVIRDIPSL